MAELRTVNPLVVGSSPTLGAMKHTEILTQSFHLLGKKVELIFTDDKYTKLTSGAQGIINFIDDAGTIFVSWDDGSTLGLIPGVDRWKVLW